MTANTEITGFRFEIPSVEHPRLATAVLEEADRRGVRIGRLSQGSGLRLLTDEETEEMLELAHGAGAELFLFVSSRNSFEPLTDPMAGDALRGEAAFEDAVRELQRCAELGVDGVLVADTGLLARAGAMVASGELELKLKTAAAIAPRNAAAAALYERLGATSINVASTSSLEDMLSMRAALSDATTIDVYVENPDGFGGGMLYRDVHELLRLAPAMLKIGLRNSPTLYPYGAHLEPAAAESAREKVRRAAIVLRELELASQGT